MALAEKTLDAAFWSVAGQSGKQAVLIAVNIVLARLLSPGDFGLLAMVVAVANFAIIIAEQGFGAALVQKQDAGQRELSSVFWVDVFMGAVLAAAFLLGAPLMARLYGEPRVEPIARLLAALFLVQSLGLTQATILRKALDFRRLAVVETAAALAGGAVGVTLALRGFGVWSIAWQSLASAAATSAGLWLISGWRPGLRFDWTAVAGLYGFSASVTLNNILGYWVRNIDNILIGRYLGAQPLGLYSRAYSVMLFPLSRISRTISRVLFPSLASVQGDLARMRSMLLGAARSTALVTFPLMAGVMAAAPDFVAVIFGPQWTGMIGVLRVLCVAGMVESVGTLFWTVYLARARPGLDLKINLALYSIEIAAIAAGLRWGIEGVARAYVCAAVFTTFVDAAMTGRLIGLRLSELLSALKGIAAAAAAMAGAVLWVGSALPPGAPAVLRLGAEAACGAAVYWALLHGFGVKGYRELRELAAERFLKRRSAGA